MPKITSPETLEAVKALLSRGATQKQAARETGIGQATISRHVERWTLEARPPAVPPSPATPWPGYVGDPPETGLSVADSSPLLAVEILPMPPDGTPLRDRMERLLAHRIAALEAEAARGVPVDREANARALALNARTLAQIRRVPETEADRPPSGEPPPRSLGELRDELRRHLERIADEERVRRLARKAELRREKEGSAGRAEAASEAPDGS